MGEFRINIDWASMLYAREFVFTEKEWWIGHLRLDSSPQFAKNYLVGEIDKVCCSHANPSSDTVLDDIQIVVRLLPLQVLGKLAANTAYKTRSCNHMLNLECDSGLARFRLRSLMSDMGVESGLWTVPDFTSPEEKFFPFILPIADLDHGIHHAMKETEGSYETNVWATYEKRLSGISKMFSRRETVDRFVKFHIWDSHTIPPVAKKSLANMFRTTCPSLCKHRWQYNFEVLRWLTKRQQFFQYLQPQMISENRDESDMGKEELVALTDMLADPHAHAFFWTMAWLEYIVHSWGFSVSRWLHGCMCHSSIDLDPNSEDVKCCKWNGRRLIQVAEGKLVQFRDELLALRVETHHFAYQALQKLKELDALAANSLHNSFQTAIKRVGLRFTQATSYLMEFPWNLASLLGFIVPQPAGISKATKIQQSKTIAKNLLGDFEAGKIKTVGYFDRFFQNDKPVGQSLRRWATETDCTHMPSDLFTELIGYSTSLLVMQRLEARHHLVCQRMAIARASTPMTLSANLRRGLNSDSRESVFRERLESYMMQFHLLLPEHTCAGRLELSRLVSGYHFDIMFADRAAEQAIIQADATPTRNSSEHNERLAHLKSVLKEGSFYAIQQSPSTPATDTDQSFIILQVVSINPAAKKYMQKVVKWTDDPWYEQLGAVVMGTTAISKQNGTEAIASDDMCTLPTHFSFTSTKSCPTEVPASLFFINDFDGVYEFKDIDYSVSFAWDAVSDVLKQTCDSALMDLTLQFLV